MLDAHAAGGDQDEVAFAKIGADLVFRRTVGKCRVEAIRLRSWPRSAGTSLIWNGADTI